MTLSKAERAERDAEKQALAQSKANQDEWDQLVKDASKHTDVICDLIGSTLPEEREHLGGRLRYLFLTGGNPIPTKPNIYWARGLRILANKIVELQTQVKSLTASAKVEQDRYNALRREFEAYQSGVRDSSRGHFPPFPHPAYVRF